MKLNFRKTSLAAFVLLAATACVKDDLTAGGAESGLISFSIMPERFGADDSRSETKSPGSLTLLSDDGDSLNLSISVSDNLDGIGSVYNQSDETKGVQITASNLKYFNIGINAFLTSTSAKFIDDQLSQNGTAHSYDPDGTDTAWEGTGHWEPVDGHTYYWPKSSSLDFWAWTPCEKIDAAFGNTDTDKPTISAFIFDHESKTVSFIYDLGEGTSATDMPDLMFANVNDLTKGNVSVKNSSGCVPLPFKHALAAVSFKIEAGSPGTVTKIEIGGAAKSGSCTFAKDGASFNWTGLGYLADGKTYKQDFNTTEGLVPSPDTPAAPYRNESVGGKNENAAFFMMIPQDLTDDGQYVSITFNYSGQESKTYTGYLDNDNISGWEAGKAYVYTLKIKDSKIDITVDDKVTETEKSDLEIRNTGDAPAFIRVAIVGNWVNNAGRIISPLEETDGIYTNLGLTLHGWVKSGDYYYYMNELAPGATAPKLFEKFIVAHKPDMSLQMDIIVQAITTKGYTHGADYYSAWKEAAGVEIF